MTPWTYVWDSLCSEDFSIFGAKFAHAFGWTRVKGEFAEVVDPIYGESSKYPIYAREFEGKGIVRVAYTEHTPGVYLAYVNDPIVIESVDPKSTRVIKYK